VSELDLVDTSEGTRLRLRVKPGAKRTSLLGVHGGALKIAVNAPPERGKANSAVVDLLAEALGLPPDAVGIVGGAGSPDKVVIIDLPAEELKKRLGAVLSRKG